MYVCMYIHFLLQSTTMYSFRLQCGPVQLCLLTMYIALLASSFSNTHSAPQIQFIRRCRCCCRYCCRCCLRRRSLYRLRTSTSLCSIYVPHAALHFYHPLSTIYSLHFTLYFLPFPTSYSSATDLYKTLLLYISHLFLFGL